MHPGQERFKYKENMKQELGPLKRGVKTFGKNYSIYIFHLFEA